MFFRMREITFREMRRTPWFRYFAEDVNHFVCIFHLTLHLPCACAVVRSPPLVQLQAAYAETNHTRPALHLLPHHTALTVIRGVLGISLW